MRLLGLALAAALAAGSAAGTAGAQESGAQEAAAPPASAAAAGLNPLSTLSLDELEATRALPLFTPSRTPPVVEELVEPEVADVEPEIAEEPEPEPPQVLLIGIVTTGSEQVAILLEQGTNEIVQLRSGEDYQDWTLTITDTRTVEFANGDLRQELTMFTEFGDMPAPAEDYYSGGEDWDGDGVPDGRAPPEEGPDLDGDGVADGEPLPAESADLDGDGIPDDEQGFQNREGGQPDRGPLE